jgi:hypothetical protein
MSRSQAIVDAAAVVAVNFQRHVPSISLRSIASSPMRSDSEHRASRGHRVKREIGV